MQFSLPATYMMAYPALGDAAPKKTFLSGT